MVTNMSQYRNQITEPGSDDDEAESILEMPIRKDSSRPEHEAKETSGFEESKETARPKDYLDIYLQEAGILPSDELALR